MIFQCKHCGKDFSAVPARASTAKYCSRACYGAYRKTLTGEKNFRWLPGQVRSKPCEGCGVEMRCEPPLPITSFLKRKYCTKACADKHAFRYSGKDHPRWDPGADRDRRDGKHATWANLVLARDSNTCQHCGATDVELHAHHVKSYKDFPALRYDVSNGLTLCYACHWKVHTASDENAVNSANPLTRDGEGNAEPSFEGNLVEGVTTSGRAYRRVIGNCPVCGERLSRTIGERKRNAGMFCSTSCSAKFHAKQRLAARWPHKHLPMAVTATTSAAPETDDIV